jgi:hypothetical protein
MQSLCAQTDLTAGLLSEENLKILVELCDSVCILKDEEGPSTVAFHTAQALSIIMKCAKTLS